jgi:BlaR1 peptidase M56
VTISLWLTRLFGQLSVGVWSTNWPLILLPIVACFSAERLSSQLTRSPIQNTRKHVLALLLATLPGLVFLSLGINALIALRHAEVDSPLCVMVFVVPIVIFSVGLCRASISWRGNRLFVRQLLDQTYEADPIIRELAAHLGLTLRILPTEYMACMTVGVVRPIVILSSGAANHLSRDELKAVLLHEQVHVKNKDTLWAGISRYIADCAFSRTSRAEDLAKRTRETIADQEASKEVDRFMLANVLIKFARHSPTDSYAFFESFACPSTVFERVENLLNNGPVERGQDIRPLAMKIALACMLVLYPCIVRLIAVLLHC